MKYTHEGEEVALEVVPKEGVSFGGSDDDHGYYVAGGCHHVKRKGLGIPMACGGCYYRLYNVVNVIAAGGPDYGTAKELAIATLAAMRDDKWKKSGKTNNGNRKGKASK